MIDPLGGPAYWLPFALALLVGYLFGSVPFGLLLTRVAGAGDLRAVGSGNIGATNVLRTGRKGLAAATLLLDAAKGFLPTGLLYAFLGPDMAVAGGAGAVLGHCFPLWLRFKGGKGVATALGVVLALTPLVAPLGVAAFAAIVYLSRYVSLGSLLAAPAVCAAAYLLGHVQFAELYLFLSAVIVLKHHANVRRLLNGTENRVSLGR